MYRKLFIIVQEANAKNQEGLFSFLNYTFTEEACATKVDGYPRNYQVYVDSSYCDEPDWAEITNLLNADGSVGAKLLIDPEWKEQ